MRCLLLCLLPFWLKGQDAPATSSEATARLKAADRALKNGAYDLALDNYRLALSFFREQKDCYYEAYAQLWISEAQYYLSDYQSGLEAVLSAENVARRCMNTDTLNYFGAVLQNAGLLYSMLGQYDQQMHYYQRQLRWVLQAMGPESKASVDAYANLAVAHGRRGRWGRCINLLDSAMQIAQRAQQEEALASIYNNLAYAYGVRRDWSKALLYQRQCIKYAKNDELKARGWNNLGSYYLDLQRYEQARKFLLKALELRRKIYPIYHDNISYTLFNLCRLQYEQKAYEEAEDYVDRVIANLTNVPRRYQALLLVAYHYKAVLRLRTGQLEEADRYSRLALRVAGNRLRVGASTMLVRSMVLEARERYPESLDFIQRALRLDIPGFDASDPGINPQLTQIENPNTGLDLLARKAHVLLKWGASRSDTVLLRQSLDTYYLLDSLIDYMRQTFRNRASGEILSANVREVYEGAVAACYRLYDMTGDTLYFDQGFIFSEKNKSLAVLEQLRELHASSFSVAPDSTIRRERTLLQDIEFYTNQLRYRPASVPQTTVDRWEDSLFHKRREQRMLIDQLSRQFPNYHNLRYNLTPVGPAEMASLLEERELLVEYFSGKDFLYVWLIDDGLRKFVAIPIAASLERSVRMFRNALLQRDTQFYANSHALYQQLMEPLQNLLEERPLVIVPDGILGYLPFEALLTAAIPREDWGKHATLPYLLKRRRIRYWFSGNVAWQSAQLGKRKASRGVLALAPQDAAIAVAGDSLMRSTGAGQLAPLMGTDQELKLLKNLFRGKFLSGERASEAFFRQKSDQYRMVHIATHALLNDRFPNFSHLLLAEGEKDDGALHAFEVFNLRLRADLVTLSACGTGYGRLLKGEGIASLARAFTFAGAPNLIVSQWPVKDNTTSDFMAYFYRNIHAGMPKGVALHQAKLRFLDEQAPQLTHPYFWAPFIYIGDRQAVTDLPKKPAFSIIPGLLLVLATLVVIGMVVLRKRRA